MNAKAILFRWPERTFDGALEDYQAAQDFVLKTGLFRYRDAGGYIKSPRHPDHPETARNGIVPPGLIDDPRWHVAVVVYTHSMGTQWIIENQVLPAGCTRTTTDVK